MTASASGAPASSVWSRIVRFVVVGPDPPDPRQLLTLLGRLLSWPARLFITAALWALAFVWRASELARPLAWGLVYGGVVAVSLAASIWTIVFAVNAGLGTLWLWGASRPPPSRRDRPIRWYGLHIIEFLNRQASHFEAFWIWMAVVLTAVPRIHFQLPLLAAVALLGFPCVNGIARRRDPNANKIEGTLQVARRSAIYTATLLGLGLIVARSGDDQAVNVVPLVLAIGAGLVLRGLRVRLRARVNRKDHNVRAFRQAQMRWSRGPDVLFGPTAALGAILALAGLAAFGRNSVASARKAALDGLPPRSDACVPEQGGPSKPEIVMFLVGDSHAHELGGARFPGQTELVDTVGNSALRPVELDILSGAPISQFARAFGSMLADGPRQLYWAHLGDFGDLGCTGELDRARRAFAAFPADRFAGIAPGNHDARFTGNFFWSPFWTPACKPGGRLDKHASIVGIEEWISGSRMGSPDRTTVATPVSSWPRWLGGQSGALVTVTPLGVLHGSHERGVAAIFIDSTDGQAFDWGVAGLYGTFSAAQARLLETEVRALPARAGAAYADPIWIVFSHHRLEDMAGPSASRLDTFLAWLDREGAPSATALGDAAPHLLAIVAAHTHSAETNRHCIGGRIVRELVIGSAIDPPQQAALLDVGLATTGVPAARLKTLPSVARPGLVCGDTALMVDAQTCHQMLATLRAAPACEPLLREQKRGPDCSTLQKVPSLKERLRAIARDGGVREPEDIRIEQAARTRNLMTCICRSGAPGADGPRCAEAASAADLLENAGYAAILEERTARAGEAAERELACLSWAAAAIQRYKTAGMTFAAALRCGFDDRTLPAAQDSVASLEMTRCR